MSDRTPATNDVRERHARFVNQRTDRCDYDELLWPCDAVLLANEVDRLRKQVRVLEDKLYECQETLDSYIL
jgi:hypothetical protein